MTSVQLELGDVVTRAEMQAMFGGGPQGGIIPSGTTDNILIYADHDSGKDYGYQDGWLAEEDEKGPVFEYTGQGVEVDQTAFLTSRGHEVQRVKIRVKGLTATFWTDLYDVTDNVLYELKGSSGRNAVRMAIGQLHDYGRHIPKKDARLVVTLPEKPVDDLAELIAHAGMELVYEDGDQFIGWTAG